MEDIQHFSQIRIGDRVIYNGVNGDAFSFGEKPPAGPKTDQNGIEHSKSQAKTSNGAPLCSSDTPAKFTDQLLKMTSLKTADVIKISETFTSLNAERDYNVQRSTSAPPSESITLNSAETTHEGARLQMKPLSQLSISVSPHLSWSPTAVGLPPILPPPPAAHLPPPLPSRPPSAVPSPSSSLSSLLSFRYDDKSLATPPPSPTQSSEVQNVNDESPDVSPNYLRNFFFRSSGTIKVEAPSRDLHHTTLHPQLSPPPLPLPVPLTSSSSLSPSSILTVSTSGTKSSNVFQPPEHNESVKAVILSIPSNASLTSASSTKKASSTSPSNDSEEEDADTADSCENHAGRPTDREVRTDNVSVGGELVDARDGNKIFSKKCISQTKASRQNSEVSRNIFPPEFGSIRKQSVTYVDVISSVLMVYKLTQGVKKKKKLSYDQPKLEKAPQCRKCGRQFGLRCFRYHCSRCKKSFCDTCTPVMRVDTDEHSASSLSRICELCSEEVAYETSKGAYRGVWSEFKELRAVARAQRGLDVTSSNTHKSLESQSMQDVTPGLTSLCLRFLVDVHHQLEKQPRHKFLANYLHFENQSPNRLKGKTIKNKECQACSKQLRMLSDIRDCDLCLQTFCLNCTYRTLQLYLPPGTDVKGDILIEGIKFHVKDSEQDEAQTSEVSEMYRLCAGCEDDMMRNLKIHEFNQKIPEVETEMFDLQRQIDHSLTYGPHFHGMQRSVSANNLSHMSEHESMATNIKLANQLYGRYMRAYDNLDHMVPQTPGQKTLHKHIKQAMYDFYVKRRNQLKSTLRRRDSWTTESADLP